MSWEAYGPYFAGTDPAPGDKVALAYQKSVHGNQTGQTYRNRELVLLPLMMKHKWGRIINIASVAGMRAVGVGRTG
jgi:NAD(P)-dependent dehydrogenase (short-subunit alcohol dehydrogenase family)